MFVCHARLDHIGHKHIYAKARKIRFVNKYKWTSPLVNIIWQEKQQEDHLILERFSKSLISIAINSFQYL